MKLSEVKSVPEADIKQWADWRRLTPAQRWDEYARFWWQTYGVRKKARTNILRAVQRSFGRAEKT